MDDALRALERRWRETGSVEDEAAWLVARLRVGDLSRARLERASFCGHAGARRIVEAEQEVPPDGASKDVWTAWAIQLCAAGRAVWRPLLRRLALEASRHVADAEPAVSAQLRAAADELAAGRDVPFARQGDLIELARTRPDSVAGWAARALFDANGWMNDLAAAGALAETLVRACGLGVSARALLAAVAKDALAD